MAFVLELFVFSHHDDGDIIERHTLFSDPNAENVALLRDNVVEAFEMSGYQPQSWHDYEHYYVTPSDRETDAVGLQLIPTLFDEEPDPRNLSNTLSALTRFDLGTQTVPPTYPPGQKRVLLLHTLFEEPPNLLTPLAVGTPADVKRQKERAESLLEALGFTQQEESMELKHRRIYFTDEPLEATPGSSDVVLLRGLLNATALQDLREFHDNPKGLQTLLAHGLLQWD